MSEDDDSSVGVVKKNLARIRGSFATLVTRVTDKLKRKSIDMSDFRLYVFTLFPPGDLMSRASSIAEVCEVLSRHQLWDYYHYSPVEEIAKKFADDDPEISMWISDYKCELAGFKATTKIADFIKTCNDEEDIADSEQSIRQDMARYDKRYCRKLTFKLKVRVTIDSLVYIDEFWRSIADHFFIPCLSVLLDRIREGCLEVTWCVPTLMAIQIQANLQDSTEFLQQMKIS